MKFLFLFFLIVLSPQPAGAQDLPNSSEAPTVIVLQAKWRKDIYIPALYDDPMRVNDEQADLARQQKLTVQQNAVRVQQGNNPQPLPVRLPSNNVPLGQEVIYQYQAKIKNTGSKTISAIDWEYLLFDPDTEVEIGHHRFRHTLKVRPNKTTKLTTISANPPTATLPAQKAADKAEPKFSERVVITRIEYDDGSWWQRPLN
jgi:hypothetical protein